MIYLCEAIVEGVRCFGSTSCTRTLTRELLEEATGILDEGEFWFRKVPFTFDAKRYLLPSVVADWGKGVPIQNFKP